MLNQQIEPAIDWVMDQGRSDRVGAGWVFVPRLAERDIAVALTQGILAGDGDRIRCPTRYARYLLRRPHANSPGADEFG